MSQQASHLWKPIEGLPPNAAQLANPQTASLVAAWKEHVKEMKDRRGYDQFLIRLRREWAIETGIIERLYSLSEGATKTLIEKGFDEALISHDDTDRPAHEVIAIISDQYRAIEGLYQFISGNRPLGTSYIKELHRVLTEHQPRYDAIDTLGDRVERDLPRGEWKKLPNNVEGPDGFTFQFCPPEHVAAEMDRLLRMHEEHAQAGVPPDAQAAWLHHRFTLIHPFTDGNGRVARCLASLILLKAEWFPLVVTRQDRTEYIETLRAADSGNLAPIVQMFDRLQDRSIREALSLKAEMDRSAEAVGTILEGVKSRYSAMRGAKGEKEERLTALGDTLLKILSGRLSEVAGAVKSAVEQMGTGFHATWRVENNNPLSPNENYHYQIDKCAREQGYFANTLFYQSYSLIEIWTDFRMTLLFSIHGMGRDFTGILACSGMAIRQLMLSEDSISSGEIHPLTDSPFQFTYAEDPADVSRRFKAWLEPAILSGLDYWREAVGA